MIEVTVNGRRYREEVEPRLLLSDFLRHTLGLTGTHVGCEHGVCGACTVHFDGVAVGSVVDRPTLLEIDPERPGKSAAEQVEPWGTLHASADYLRALVHVLVDRVVGRVG